jgi:hypothetical protein
MSSVNLLLQSTFPTTLKGLWRKIWNLDIVGMRLWLLLYVVNGVLGLLGSPTIY